MKKIVIVILLLSVGRVAAQEHFFAPKQTIEQMYEQISFLEHKKKVMQDFRRSRDTWTGKTFDQMNPEARLTKRQRWVLYGDIIYRLSSAYSSLAQALPPGSSQHRLAHYSALRYTQQALAFLQPRARIGTYHELNQLTNRALFHTKVLEQYRQYFMSQPEHEEGLLSEDFIEPDRVSSVSIAPPQSPPSLDSRPSDDAQSVRSRRVAFAARAGAGAGTKRFSVSSSSSDGSNYSAVEAF